jgi:hypothetical protein
MTGSQVIVIAAMVVPAATAFLIGYWHRKQMRQIEAFRQNPSVGLMPPPSPVYAFVLAYRTLLVGVGLPGLMLILELARESPVTRFSVFTIAFAVASMLFALILHLIQSVVRILEKAVDLAARIMEASRKDHGA